MTEPPMDVFAGLNPQQKKAVFHREGPLLVLAGAGSGKTRVITCRIAYLVREAGVAPQSIRAVTFTNKAAQEMAQRVRAMLGADGHPTPRVSTFHSFCTGLLRRHAPLLGYTRDFTIYDSDDQLKLANACLKGCSISETLITPRKAVSAISLAKNSLLTRDSPQPFAARRDGELYQRVYSLYASRLRSSNAMDFDDLLLNSLALLEEHPEVRERYQRDIQHLLVDEYQDTNRLQYLLVRQLAHPPYNICAVGDEDQSIYRFRGAHLGNILSFEEDIPGVEVIKLEQNYRSTQRILEAASTVVRNNEERKDKTLWTRNQAGDLIRCLEADSGAAEAAAVCETLLALKREGLDESFAVLYRTNSQSRYFEETFRREGVPYNLVGGLSFYARAEIRDLVAYLRLLRNPGDEMALARIINTPPRGIGDTTVERLRAHAAESGCGTLQAAEQFAGDQSLSGRAWRALGEFVQLVEELRAAAESLTLSQLIREVASRSGYLRSLEEEDSPEARSRLGNIEELCTAAAEWEEQGLGMTEFLDRASLASDTDDYDPQSRVVLMTLHSAKGLEFDVVFLAGMEEGLFPHAQSQDSAEEIEEERRICYVGMTRARRRLFLSWARYRRSFGASMPGENKPSRFLREIPRPLMEFIRNGYASREPSWEGVSTAPAPVASVRPQRSYAGETYNSTASVREFLNRKKGSPARTPAPAPRSVFTPAVPAASKEFPPGTRVQHATFGEGYVLQATPEGGDTKLIVHFPGYGKKKLIQKYSKLVKI